MKWSASERPLRLNRIAATRSHDHARSPPRVRDERILQLRVALVGHPQDRTTQLFVHLKGHVILRKDHHRTAGAIAHYRYLILCRRTREKDIRKR